MKADSAVRAKADPINREVFDVKAKLEKICLDNDCTEPWSKAPEGSDVWSGEFVYCPYCAGELHLQCSACHESLSSKDFRYCPWCGAEFEK